jgi:hypothetical protein
MSMCTIFRSGMPRLFYPLPIKRKGLNWAVELSCAALRFPTYFRAVCYAHLFNVQVQLRKSKPSTNRTKSDVPFWITVRRKFTIVACAPFIQVNWKYRAAY